ncbi:MAG: glutathione S-transferase family protein [Pseudomonadota bacterium]|nr:glutathione S-transferase family protein [Pseudomonadota bacterium]
MRTLLAFPTAFGVRSPSPFVWKAMLLLDMAGLDYEVTIANPVRAPKGKLPVLVDDGKVIPDSSFIRRHIEARYGIDPDDGLEAGQRAQAQALVALIEDRLYWALVFSRWFEPHNAPRVRDAFFGALPLPLRRAVFALVRRRVRAQLRGHGIGRHSRDEIYLIGREALDAVAASLGGRAFLMGNRPSATDATAYPMLASILIPALASPLQDHLRTRPELLAYCDRCRRALESEGQR